MKSRTLINLGLLILVGVLTALVLREPGKEAPPEPERLTALNPAEIRQVRIERVGQEMVAAERGEDGEWRLTAPRGLPANGHRLDALLKVAEAATRSRFPVESNLEAYGLSEPRVRLQLDDVTLTFGDTTPIDQHRYVRRGETIYLVGDSWFYHLIGDIGTFASHRLLPDAADLEAISLPGLNLRQRNGKWETAPEAPDTSADAVARLVDNWRHARAIEVKEWDAPLPEGETIRVNLAGQADPVEFIIASREPQTVLARPAWRLTYHLPDSVAKGLFSLPELPQER
ncbi:DUF4340 domain-containing protein [Thiohalomonas denitrificans]|uniref:DUF4340 domain-containing protein n=1 Tax=Thiohalomonas denitrificans TaxID=415747 RepID=A0A1G5PUZ2_9GAMM|nr:DUF4340 domain-containing protein [Thiohalomonas denitrificans]SCZ53237.1 protein of unknown function [Thiohalomonas denitrificans]